MYEYQATFEWYIKQANADISGLQGDPCVIDLDSYVAPICDELCKFMSKIIYESVIIMTPLLKFSGVEEKSMSQFFKRFSSPKELLHKYIAYCPKIFSYNNVNDEFNY